MGVGVSHDHAFPAGDAVGNTPHFRFRLRMGAIRNWTVMQTNSGGIGPGETLTGVVGVDL